MNSIERAMQRARKPGGDAATDPGSPKAETLEHPAVAAQEENLRLRPQVDLDLAALRERGFLTPDAEQRELQEQYRMVKRPLLRNAFAQHVQSVNPANLIQVTSSLDREGKTFSAFNLSVSIAMEFDYTVLVVDGDLTRQSLTHLFRLEGKRGLTDLLGENPPDADEVIVRTNIPGLRVIPAGKAHPRSSELMASDAMRRLTLDLAARYPDRVILFDSTPLMIDSQAPALARHMGQALVVVEAARTSEKLLQDSLALIDQSLTRVSLLLNKAPRGYGQGYYGGYY